MDYITIYELSYNGTKLIHIVPLLIFTFLGIGLIYYLKRSIKEFTFSRQFFIFFGYLLGGIPCLMLILTIIKTPSIIKEEKELKEILETKKYNVIEGVVKDYFVREVANQIFESFTINGVKFEYSDNIIIDGFHQTAKNGGPIDRNGLRVRVSYITKNNKNTILKLEMNKLEP